MNKIASSIPPSAKSSMIFGLLGSSMLPLVASIPAIILGHRAARAIKANPDGLRGEGLALGGMILGYLGVIYGIALIALLPYLQANRHKKLDTSTALHMEQTALTQLEQITRLVLTYAETHEGQLPPDLTSVITDRGLWKSPYDPNQLLNQPSYRLISPNQKLTDLGPPAGIRLIEDRYRSWNGERGIAYADGRTEFVAD